MLWVPTLKPVVLQLAVLVLPLPLRLPAGQMALPPSVKVTLPVGLVPATVAVKVTLLPSVAGLPELVSVVVVEGKPAAMPQASISVIRDHESLVPVMVMRMLSAVKAAKLTVRLTRLLP